LIQNISAQEKVQLSETSLKLPQLSGDWKVLMTDVLKISHFEQFWDDPNYMTSEYLDGYALHKKAMVELLENQELVKGFYKWVEPVLKDRWETISYFERAELRRALQHCQRYLKNFSLEKEDAYLRACRRAEPVDMGPMHLQFNRGLGGTDYFTRWAPKKDFFKGELSKPKPESATSVYRRLETFLYRRIKEGALLETMQWILTELLTDLTVPKNKKISSTVSQKQMLNKKENTRLVKETLTFKKRMLHGPISWECDLPYYYEMITGSYKKNKRIGTWTTRLYHSPAKKKLKDEVIIQYKKGKIVKRTWTSYWGGKPHQRIGYDLNTQNYRFSKFNKKGEEVVEKEGNLYSH